MRCSQAEHLLSLNLDGRLASGQRRVLLEHLAGCTRCRSLDRELEAARELALSLPLQRVGPSFREELWQRIRAGEGTPEAVFHEPVSLRTKVRYFATGVAAAGVLLAATHLLRPRPEPAPVVDRQAQQLRPVDVATAPMPPATASRTPLLEPATPAQLATLVTDAYTDAVRKLRDRAADLDQRPTPEAVEHIREQAERAGRFAGLLRWMVKGEYLHFAEDDAASIAAIEVLGGQVRDFRDPESLRRVLRPLHGLRVDQPRSYFCTTCVTDEVGFYHEFLDRLRSAQLDKALRGKLQVVVEPTPVGTRQFRVLVVR